jgi:hypothetical protein
MNRVAANLPAGHSPSSAEPGGTRPAEDTGVAPEFDVAQAVAGYVRWRASNPRWRSDRGVSTLMSHRFQP